MYESLIGEAVPNLDDLDGVLAGCRCLFSLLRERNESVNLTRIVEEEDFWIKHVLDSLLLVRHRPELVDGGYEIADIGCGAGFPSLVLALALPGCGITAIDSAGKKISFVEEAAEMLRLSNLNVVRGRGRELAAQSRFQGRYDIVAARAVGSALQIFREVRRMLGPEGTFELFKTPECAAAELAEVQVRAPGFDWVIGDVFELPGGAGERCFLSGRAGKS